MSTAGLFYFKHFVIDQQNCAMKIGADSMLLGSLAKVEDAAFILDIGTGTGVLALMLAQRTNAQIHAVEIEENAYQQAVKNALHSIWKGRITVFHSALQDFELPNNLKYDLIISNPPYFIATNSAKSKSPNGGRAIARDQHQLSFNDLVENSARLVSAKGKFTVIIPFNAREEFIEIAKKNALFLHEEIDIRSRYETEFIRVILTFSFTQSLAPLNSSFTIYRSGNIYTEEYLQATENYHAHNMRKRGLM